MAHIQTAHLGLWKPQDLTIDKISSQKMFVDNINMIEAFAEQTLQNMHKSVKSLADLRAINTSDTALFKNGTLIMVQDNGMYSFNRNSTADDDNNAIIAPTTGGGRWITIQGTDIVLTPLGVNSATELDNLLTNILTNMSINSIKFTMIRGIAAFYPLDGGMAHVTVYKSNNLYASVMLFMYNFDRITRVLTRSRYDGIWGRWVSIPFLDDNGKIPLDQLPSGIMSASVE